MDVDYEAGVPRQVWPYPTSPQTLRGEGMINKLHQEVARLIEEIDQLYCVLTPVRTVSPEIDRIPDEAPSNQLHEAIIMIERSHRRLNLLRQELYL